MRRSILIGSVLTLMLLCVLSAGGPAEARRCGYDNCVALYNECEAGCGGSRPCIKACQRDYTECVCYNCGLCPINPLQAAPKTRTSGAAVNPVTANGYAPTFPALFYGTE